MSEEYGLKFVVNGEDYDKIKKSLNKQIEDLQQKVEQLENTRKEAIEYINNHQLVFRLSSKKQIENWFDELYKDLLKILNRGDNKYE